MKPDRSPDLQHRRVGQAVDISCEGIGVLLDSAELMFATDMILALTNEERPGCLGVEICHQRITSEGQLRLGGRFGGAAEDLLQPANLTPKFNSASFKFGPAFPEELLDRWCQTGVMTSELWDKVQLCPKCKALPTFRLGCGNCGSVRIVQDQLMHHFACAHVGLVTDFEVDSKLTCPKCRQKPLVVGSDYEYTSGLYRCQDCSWTAPGLEQIGQCHSCGLRFPGYQAIEQELKGYRALRLDPLALLPLS
jgi:hypothetical protein